MAKASRKRTTRVFTASGGAGSTTAAWTRFSLARCRGFIRTAVSIRRPYMATARQRRRKRLAEPRLQRPQEGEGRQGRRLLRSPVQRDRAVRGGGGQL